MPEPVYRDALTKASEARLAQLVRGLPQPVSIAGGHAVRLRVGNAWRERFGQDYFGSRDIDVVYHVDPAWSEPEFRASAAAQAPARLKAMKFKPEGAYSFALYVDDDGNELDRPPGPPKQQGTDYHALIVDPIVTRIHPLSKQVLGYHPIDEPLFDAVFADAALRTAVAALGQKVFLPTTPVLVATKLKSLPTRTKDDKEIKDLCDLYALLTYGGSPMKEVRSFIHTHLPNWRQLTDGAMRHDRLATAAGHLDADVRDLRAVLGPLALK